MNRDNIFFHTYKVEDKLPLAQLAAFFNLNQDIGRSEYIKINDSEIGEILKYSTFNKSIYLYKYGCITFVNFNRDEVHIFLEYLKGLFIEPDEKLISKFYEHHALHLLEDNSVTLCESSDEVFNYQEKINDIAAYVLAKSTELNKTETELNDVLDYAGRYISYLNKGYLRANNKKAISTIGKCIKFKYGSIESIKLLDIPPQFNKTIELRHIFDILSEYFELNDRYNILKTRMNMLDSITNEYFSYRSRQSARRLILFEVFLLSLFPLLNILN